jgi:hypothetical protein
VVLWPYDTGQRFQRLVREGRFDEANQLLSSSQRWTQANGEWTVRTKPGQRGRSNEYSPESITLSARDFPLGGSGGEKGKTESKFGLTSARVNYCWCEIACTAHYGTVDCDSITLWVADQQSYPIVSRRMPLQEWTRRRDEPLPGPQGVPAHALPATADQVLPALVGRWDFQMDYKVINGQPVNMSTRGIAVMDMVARRFLRRRVQTAGGQGLNQLGILSFDAAASEFRDWQFDALGISLGPVPYGRWDSAKHSITWLVQAPEKTTSITILRFEDANSVVMEFKVVDKDKNIAHTLNRLTRSFPPPEAKLVEIDEMVQPLGTDGKLLVPPPEMAVLQRMVGEWRSDGFVKIPVQAPSKSKITYVPVLGGRYVTSHEKPEYYDAEFFGLETYDSQNKLYRYWHFASTGPVYEYRGNWDSEKERLTWTGSGPDGNSLTATMQWRGPDQYEQTVQARNSVGQLTTDVLTTVTRRKDAKASRGKLPETAEEALAAMVGNWRVEYVRKVVNGQQVNRPNLGVTVVDWVSGKRWLRQRTQIEQNGPNYLIICDFDPKSGDVREWYFDDQGGLDSGPARWDKTTHTLIGAGGTALKTTKFIDADTIEWDLTFRDKTGKVMYDARATMKRASDKVDVREDAASVPAPVEMGILDQLVGDWHTDGVTKTPDNPAGEKFTTETSSRKILGGWAIESTEPGLPGHEGAYWLTTWDKQLHAYRFWLFSVGLSAMELGGNWDGDAQMMKWHHAERDGSHSDATWKWTAPGTREWTTVIKDAIGKVLYDLKATSVRKK